MTSKEIHGPDHEMQQTSTPVCTAFRDYGCGCGWCHDCGALKSLHPKLPLGSPAGEAASDSPENIRLAMDGFKHVFMDGSHSDPAWCRMCGEEKTSDIHVAAVPEPVPTEGAAERDAMKQLLREYIDEELRGGIPYDRYSSLTLRAMRILGMTAPPSLLDRWRKEVARPSAPEAAAALKCSRCQGGGEDAPGIACALCKGKGVRQVAIPAAPIAPAAEELIQELEKTLKALKIRIAFIGWPKEPMNENGPDWGNECALLEAALARAEEYRKGAKNGTR